MASQIGLPAVVLESLATAVVVLDQDSRVLLANAAAEELMDLSASQVLGLPLGELLPVTRALEGLIERVRRESQPLTERDLWLEIAPTRAVNVDCTVSPVPDHDAARVLVELTPLSERKRIDRELHLLSQNESARALLRGLAHEIRNPLGGLRGAAQLLERELDDALNEYTQVIVSEADRLQDLLTRMLGPRTPPRRQPVNVHEITERVFALVHAEAPPGVRVERDYDPSIPVLEVDPELMIQATLNVARNGVQAVGDEGEVLIRTRVHRQATIGARKHRLVAAIDIIDDGPGVPEPLDQSIFYPMVTGRAEGTGLGLSIAQSLVSQQDGLIEFSRQSERTVFSILLPIGEPQ